MLHRVAILIDGGFFLRRFKANHSSSPRISDMEPFLTDLMDKVGRTTTVGTDTLFRAFYYDCRPYGETQKDPNGKLVNFGKEPQFHAATRFQNDLRTFPQMALRLGDLSTYNEPGANKDWLERARGFYNIIFANPVF